MADTKYTYAVARIRSLESSLFTASTMENLAACSSYQEGLRFLSERGWGGADGILDGEDILTRESEKTWETIRSLGVKEEEFGVLLWQKLFHNLKAAIKAVCTGGSEEKVFFEDCRITGPQMTAIIREKDFASLPQPMRHAAQEAYEAMLRHRDGQLCDIILDRAALAAIAGEGNTSKVPVVQQYAQTLVESADIKIAFRAARTGKKEEFLRRALVPCKGLDLEKLIDAAVSGETALAEYLEQTGRGEAARAFLQSGQVFEKWCDDQIIRAIQPQKQNPFSVGPLIAYVLARQNEIKTVRIILTGKQNGLSQEAIRERIRETYV